LPSGKVSAQEGEDQLLAELRRRQFDQIPQDRNAKATRFGILNPN
jgi:hypothetical protein